MLNSKEVVHIYNTFTADQMVLVLDGRIFFIKIYVYNIIKK